MPILAVILVLVAVGVVLYLVNAFVPMDARVKTILNWFVIILLIVWLVRITGLWAALAEVRI